MKKPYLLAPCGSIEAVRAAISAGADECYFGGSTHNARINAKGFSEEEFFSALELIKLYGKKSNITLNTLLTDRELPEAAKFALKAKNHGADAFIVQDLGLARILKREIPDIELYASTQCACHSLEGAIELSKLGFSRIVLARELPFSEIKEITEYGLTKGNFETEVFIHGALCVCHSGMCLMSSVIGGRSGNRGLCAQPCRMNGRLMGADGRVSDVIYPLSLKDLTLSNHIKEILPLGIASLKIEGRMKSPEYVYKTVKILRTLIDKEADATLEQYGELSDIFSRGGFTDGYFTGKYLTDNKKMYGFRSDADKAKTLGASFEVPPLPKIPVKLFVAVKRNSPPQARFTCRDKCGAFSLDEPPLEAKSAPLTKDGLLKNMKKLGTTPFELSEAEIHLDDGLFLTAANINELRRGAIESLTRAMCDNGSEVKVSENAFEVETKKRIPKKMRLRIFTDNPDYKKDNEKYPEKLESICLPLELFDTDTPPCVTLPFGVRLPRVIFGSEKSGVRAAIETAVKCGARYIYVSNIGHIALAKGFSVPIYGGMGLNIMNTECARAYSEMGISCLTLSTELNSAQMRDIGRCDSLQYAAVCEGRLPLMVLESCILRARSLCVNSHKKCSEKCGFLIDRIGKHFPIYGEKRFDKKNSNPCRCIILNADVLHLYGKKDEIKKCSADILEIYDI